MLCYPVLDVMSHDNIVVKNYQILPLLNINDGGDNMSCRILDLMEHSNH